MTNPSPQGGPNLLESFHNLLQERTLTSLLKYGVCASDNLELSTQSLCYVLQSLIITFRFLNCW